MGFLLVNFIFQGCIQSCYQNAVHIICGCTDPRYPNIDAIPQCNASNGLSSAIFQSGMLLGKWAWGRNGWISTPAFVCPLLVSHYWSPLLFCSKMLIKGRP